MHLHEFSTTHKLIGKDRCEGKVNSTNINVTVIIRIKK